MPGSDTLFEIYALLGDFDASRCQMPNLWWRVHKISSTRLSQDCEVARYYTFDG